MGGMRPLPSQTTEVTATAAVNKYFVRFGCPFQIFTDRGRNFESKLFTAVCNLLEMHKVCTTPYRPSANGQVEPTLMDSFRCYIDKAQDCWDKYLAQIAGALRSVVNRHSGFTANELMLDREVSTSAILMYRLHLQESPVNLGTYVVDLEDTV